MVDTPRISLGESAAAKARRIQSTQSRVDTATVASSAVIKLDHDSYNAVSRHYA